MRVIIINKFVMQYVMYRTQANTRAVPLPQTGQTGPWDRSDRSTQASSRWDRSDRSPLTGQTGHRLPEQPKAETKDITSLKNFTLS